VVDGAEARLARASTARPRWRAAATKSWPPARRLGRVDQVGAGAGVQAAHLVVVGNIGGGQVTTGTVAVSAAAQVRQT
jgi:hypothetical protein